MVLDGSWLVHLPKVGWWLACKANLAYFLWRFYHPDFSTPQDCNSPSWQRIGSALLVVRSFGQTLAKHISSKSEPVACAVFRLIWRHPSQVGLSVWVLVITYYLGRASQSLHQRPYSAFRCDQCDQHSGKATGCALPMWTLSSRLTSRMRPAG